MSRIDQVGRSYTGTPAREPDEQGAVERDGVRIHWESYGAGEPAILLLPTWSIVHSRHWKGADPLPRAALPRRHLRRPGQRPLRPTARSRRRTTHDEFADDAVAVLDAAGVDAACVAGLSLRRALGAPARRAPSASGCAALVADRPDDPVPRPAGPRAQRLLVRRRARHRTRAGRSTTATTGCEDYDGFLEFFFSQVFSEPHSTKQIEDCVAWGLDTTPETLDRRRTACAVGAGRARTRPRQPLRGRCAARCVVVHGTEDGIIQLARGVRRRRADRRRARPHGGVRARAPGPGPGAGQSPAPRVRRAASAAARRPARRWTRSLARPKRALYVSSPIGLGHAWRDVAIADELRRQAPGLEIDWLAQEPVTTVLRRARRDDPPREPRPRQRVRAHRPRGGRARPARLPGDPADGRDPVRQLHALPRCRAGGAVRPLDRGRGLGARPLPAREPRAEDRAVRVADRLRRLPADARRAASARRS